jgi:hypothetical protein
MIQNLAFRAILENRPRKELIEGMAIQIGFCDLRRVSRLGEDLIAVVEALSIRGFTGVIERAVSVAASVGIGLLVALQMIPLRENDPPITVDARREIPRWGMIEQLQITALARGSTSPIPSALPRIHPVAGINGVRRLECDPR